MMTQQFRGFRKRIVGIILCAAMLCTLIPAALAGNVIDKDGDGVNDYLDTAYAAAAEGAVLLENDGTLPFDKDKTTVSVFGRGQIHLVEGGYGSGDVNTLESESYDFIEGMDAVGINYYKPLYEDYAEWCEANPTVTDNSRPKSEPEMPLTDSQVNNAAANSDLAVVVIRRNAGESSDRNTIKGDWLLTDLEMDILSKVNAAFDDIVIILNVGGLMDLGWVDNFDNISSILLAWSPGNYGSIAIADILAGNVTPSGKLADTWAYKYEDYPASIYGTFGTTSTSVDSDSYVDPIYGDDIYVGYRYFETFNPGAVQYEFGYGLSYTTFEQKVVDYSDVGGVITVKVKVTNTGDTYSGKEVVQVYYSAPQGVLGKPAYELAAFGKTDLLAPGESQLLSLSYKVNDMASYDDSGATGNESCYVLEAGNYKVYAGSSIKNLTEAGTHIVSALTVTERLTEAMAPTYNFNILKTGSQNSDGSYRTATAGVALRGAGNNKADKYDGDLPWVELTGQKTGARLIDVASGSKSLNEYMVQYALEDLVEIFGGQRGTTSSSTTTAINPYLAPGAFGAAGSMMQQFVDNDSSITWGISVADGPAGLRLGIDTGDTGNTAFPIGLMLATTWNLELIEEVGEAIGAECVANDVDVWLAPALNIHRDPLCGRNYEYYSEDPLVSGTMAAAATKGVQSQGVGVSVKHFAANQQERSRSGGNSIMSERALREIYLTGFEIAVKSANPWYVMTAYNKVNGSQTATDYELTTLILRKEWGFAGSVMTDWSGRKDAGNSSMLRAQNDISMPLLGTFAAPGAINLCDYVTRGSYYITTNGAQPNGATPAESTNTIDVTAIDITSAGHLTYGIYSYNSSNGRYTLLNTVGGWLTANSEASRAAILQKVLDAGYAIRDNNGNNIDINAVVAAVDDGYKAYSIYEKGTDPDDPGVVIYKYICTLNGWLKDTSDIITGVIDGRLTMGEVQRCATNLINSTIQSYNFRDENGLGAAPYTYDENENPFDVEKADVMETLTGSFKWLVEGLDWGPGVSKLYLTLDDEVLASDISADTFSVTANGAARIIKNAYLSNPDGSKSNAASGQYVTIELDFGYTQTSTTAKYNYSFGSYDGNPFTYAGGRNNWTNPYTQVVKLNKSVGIYDSIRLTDSGRLTPETDKFNNSRKYYYLDSDNGLITMSYASYTPKESGTHPLIIWLHGGGEGGTDPVITLYANRAASFASDETQKIFGGAYVLVPQCPTRWMDGYNSNSATLEGAGQSIYTDALMALIKDYVAKNPGIDTDRIYIGGCSNGGYMAMNLLLEDPGYFAAAFPTCSPYQSAHITDKMLETIVDTPIWFTHSKVDGTVAIETTTTPLYNRLVAAGAKNVHKYTPNSVVDSMYGKNMNGHWSWIYVYNNDDQCDVADCEYKDQGILNWMAKQTKKEVYAHTTYINGYNDGTFKADNSVTRAEVAKMLYGLGDLDETVANVKFSDVNTGIWYYEPVMALAKAGIINGYKDGTFKPTETITRAEFATMIMRYAKLSPSTGSTGFSDVPESDWAAGNIKAVAEAGYVKGYNNGTFRPENNLTRAEAVTVINRVLGRVGNKDNISADITIFPDVKRDHYAWADIVEAALEHNYTIVNGKEIWK